MNQMEQRPAPPLHAAVAAVVHDLRSVARDEVDLYLARARVNAVAFGLSLIPAMLGLAAAVLSLIAVWFGLATQMPFWMATGVLAFTCWGGAAITGLLVRRRLKESS